MPKGGNPNTLKLKIKQICSPGAERIHFVYIQHKNENQANLWKIFKSLALSYAYNSVLVWSILNDK